MKKLLASVVLVAVVVTTDPGLAKAALPDSDAESIEILAPVVGGPYSYWWDHTDLTVAVIATRNVDPAYTTEIRRSIARWSEILEDELDGLITLTDVSGPGGRAHQADIVMRFVPHMGGLSFCCKALCQAGKCSNVSLSSTGPPGATIGPPSSPALVGDLAMHEIGHALGLGHAERLFETTDLMGYGWIADVGFPGVEPVISACDLKALRVVWAWALEGVDPYPPTQTSVSCD